MLVIKTWGLPKMEEVQLRELHRNIVKAEKSVAELEVKSEADMFCLFPPDSMSYGLGEEIFIEITGFAPGFIEHVDMVRKELALNLRKAIREMFPGVFIVCSFINAVEER